MQTQTAAKPSQDESRITELLDQFAAALRAKDARAAIACYAHDVVAYDLAPPLRVGDAAVHAPDLLQQWFDTWSSPIVSEGHDLQITVGGDVAYAHGLRHMTGTKKDGQRSTCGSVRPPGFVESMANGRSRTCTTRCRSRWTAVGVRCSI